MILRDYQIDLKNGVYASWQRKNRNVLAVSPTGSGKTAIKAAIFADCRVPAVAIAHRQELVGQISCAMAEAGVYHRIIAPKAVIQFCITQHVKKYGKSFYHHSSPIAVAGVDTLIRRTDELAQWINQVQLWDIDEAHHVLKNNKWGKAVLLFVNAWGVGFTATPTRCDRKSLGREKSGVFDDMVLGPNPRELVNRGYLSDYIIYGPPASIDLSNVTVSDATGEYNQDQLRKEAHRSTITGDIVKHYIDLAAGKRGITFTVDVAMAGETAAAFNHHGVPAEAVSAKTPDHIRTAVIEKFQRGELLQLVNVDLFGEGMDVPAVEVVSAGRPTQSYGVYAQQFGRMMRPVYAPGFDLSTDASRLLAIASGPKPTGIYIDHVGNIKVHNGPPDRIRKWTLNDVENGRRKKDLDDAIPVTTCIKCFRAYEAVTKTCPYCGNVVEPSSRSAPEFVDGDLVEYSPELLAAMRGEIKTIDGPALIPQGVPKGVATAIRQRWYERQDAQRELRECIAYWAGIQNQVYGRSDSEAYRRFYHTFGIDVLGAQQLGRPEAEKLTVMIREQWI